VPHSLGRALRCKMQHHNKKRSERSHSAGRAALEALWQECPATPDDSINRRLDRLELSPRSQINQPEMCHCFLGRVSAAQAEMKRLAAHAACRQRTAHRLVTGVADICFDVSQWAVYCEVRPGRSMPPCVQVGEPLCPVYKSSRDAHVIAGSVRDPSRRLQR
jgi:hypothetical protein